MSRTPSARRRRADQRRTFAEPLEQRLLMAYTDATVVEGPPGTTVDAVFTVTFGGTPRFPGFVDYATADGTATAAGGDYTPTSGTLVFTSLQTRQVRVPVIGDSAIEPDETFYLDLYDDETGDPLGRATGTIVNDDNGLPPTITSLTAAPDPVTHAQTLTITAAVSDPENDASRVDFFRESDGVPGLSGGDAVLTTDTAAPYEYSASAADLPAGTNTFYARAFDARGNLGATASTTVTVTNAPPQITSFALPASIRPEQPLNLTAAVGDVEGDPLTVSFYLESNGRSGLQTRQIGTVPADTLLASDTTSPYATSVSVIDWAAGPYLFYAHASDATGSVVAQDSVRVVRDPPVVASLAVSPDPVTAGGAVTLTAAGVKDPHLLPVAVEFYYDSNGVAGLQAVPGGDTFLGSAGTPSGGSQSGGFQYKWSFPTTGMPFGTYAYYARPVNQVGTAGTPASTTGTIVHPPPAVGALQVSPGQVPRNGTITLTAVDVTDPEGAADVASVSFYRESNNVAGLQTGVGGDALLGSDGVATDGYSYAAQLLGVPEGTHTFYAVAADRAGGTSNVVSATAVVGFAPPTIASLEVSPEPAYPDEPVTLTASGVTDPEGAADVASVTFYRESNGIAGIQTGNLGDEVVGTDTTGAEGYSVVFAHGRGPGASDTYYARAVDVHGKLSNVASAVGTVVARPPSQVVARWVFYNNSAFDGFDPSANPSDDGALAAKDPYYGFGPGLTFSKVTGYERGINGVMVDVADLPTAPLAPDDFEAAVLTGAAPGTWTPVALPAVSVRPGAGVEGSDRVTLIWPDRLIRNTWLRVTVKADARTGLEQPDVFYFGNLVGDATDTGDAPTFRVDGADVLAVRRAATRRGGAAPAGGALVDNDFDFNRDGTVNVLDEVIARANLGRTLPPFPGATLPVAPTTVATAARSSTLVRTPARSRGDYLSQVLG